jgi:hypothetical protein
MAARRECDGAILREIARKTKSNDFLLFGSREKCGGALRHPVQGKVRRGRGRGGRRAS